jgi:hypothetical protein
VKGWEKKSIPCNGNPKSIGGAILVCNKIDFKQKLSQENKRSLYNKKWINGSGG